MGEYLPASRAPPHSVPAMLYKKTFTSRSERQDLQAAVEETCLLCIKICPSNCLEFLSHKIITQECSEASITGKNRIWYTLKSIWKLNLVQ